MDIIFHEITRFFSFDSLIDIIKTGNYSELLTQKGARAVFGPLIPVLLVIEIIRAYFYRRLTFVQYRVAFFTYVFNRFISRFISIGLVAFCIAVFEPYAFFKTTFNWYWFIYGYVVWEFAHFIYHYLGHKVRLFWCLHSTHHAPEYMNLSVTYAHFFLEGPYADFIRTTIVLSPLNRNMRTFCPTWNHFLEKIPVEKLEKQLHWLYKNVRFLPSLEVVYKNVHNRLARKIPQASVNNKLKGCSNEWHAPCSS